MRTKLIVAAAASSALMLATPLSASAQGSSSGPAPAAAGAAAAKVRVLNTDVVAPFGLSVSQGRVYVADGGTGKVSRLVDGSPRTIATGPNTKGGAVAGVAVSRDGDYLAYTTNLDESHKTTTLEIRGPFGYRASADLAGHEAKVNPDKKKLYGIANPSKCVRDAFAAKPELGPVNYRGGVDSNPYAVASVGQHWLVADAGGNDVLRVDRNGKVSTVAVLPRQPLKITKAIAKGIGLPACAVGFTYYFESVPTDVEVGRGGWLYVSTLAGGPETPAFGARSKVYRVHPQTGKATKVGSRLAGATDLAVKDGKIYVAELFAGRISVLENGRPKTHVALKSPLAVESAAKGLYASTMAAMDDKGKVTSPGSIVHIR